MTVQDYIDIDTIQFSENNPNRGNVEAVKNSIRELGFNVVSAIWKGIMKDGQHRIMALRELRREGYFPSDKDAALKVIKDTWQVRYLDISHMSEAQANAFMLAINRTQRLGKDNDEQLATLLKDINDSSADLMKATGYTDEHLDRLLEKLNAHQEPDINFTSFLLERHNYVLFTFDNDFDWNVVAAAFELETVKEGDDRDGFRRRGIGRVIDGKRLLEKISV